MEPTYCAAPWRGLHINFRGDVKTCCAGDPNMLGSLRDHSIQDIVFGSKMKEIRATLKSGRMHGEYCSNCIKAERYGRSERHWHNDVNRDFDIRNADLDTFDPTIIDIRWNTTCNLSCNYCGELCSSKWQSIKQGISIKNEVRPYYEQVCDFLAKHATNIREVALVGGEPLLLPENERLLDIIPKDCIVTVITNTSVDLKKNKVFKRLAQRNRVGWSMSFDNIGPRFEYVRHGGDWKHLEHNVSVIKTLMRDRGHWGGIHAVYNIYNCTRLVEFREWAHARDLTVVWQNLFQPEYLDPLRHGPRLKTLALAETQRLLDRCGSYLGETEKAFFKHAVANLTQIIPVDLSAQFAGHILQNESEFHPDKTGQFSELWPEMRFLLK